MMDYLITFEDGSEVYLMHHGVKGMKWGVWNAETRARHLGEDSKKHGTNSTLFVSGSSKTQDKESGYYRKKLPREIRKELKSSMKNKSQIIVGDAPGIDRQVQDYLAKKKYANVEVYSPGTQARYKAGKDWVNRTINDTKHAPGSKEWLAKKDIAMTNKSTHGLAVVLDDGANATRRNVERLRSQGKNVKVYELSGKGRRKDKWINSATVRSK